MKPVAVFDTHKFEIPFLEKAATESGLKLVFFEERLHSGTAKLCKDFPAVVVFVNDRLDEACLKQLSENGVKLVATRSAGFNHIDLNAAKRLNLVVCRVPEYSPHAVAEHALALLLTLNRKIHKAYHRVKELNFELEGLMGFDLYKKTLGVIGTGRIGGAFCKIGLGLGMNVMAADPVQSSELKSLGVKYHNLDQVLQESDVISLHVPLTEQTRHMLNVNSFKLLRPNCILVNTSRGALIDTKELISALKRKKIGGAALDVYEEEQGIFFENLEESGIQDDTLARLLTFPNVIVTSHQGFFTAEAVESIAKTTMQNILNFKSGNASNVVSI